MSLSAFLMSEDAVSSGNDDMSELSGGEDVVSPFLEIRDRNIVTRRDNTAFVDSSNEFNDDLLRSVVIDDFEFTDVSVLLHDSEELEENL